MIRSILIASMLTAGGFAMSSFYVFYPRAGTHYISEKREQRRSVRPGSRHYYGGYGGYRSGGLRGGK